MEILFGTISGFISSMGMGGGTILIYLLTTFSKIDQHIAQGANLVFFIPTCITAIIVNIKNKNINYRLSVPIIITGIITLIETIITKIIEEIIIITKIMGIIDSTIETMEKDSEKDH